MPILCVIWFNKVELTRHDRFIQIIVIYSLALNEMIKSELYA